MIREWAKAVLLAGVLNGLCLPAQANTTAPAEPAMHGDTLHAPILLAQTDLSIPFGGYPAAALPDARVALLLPSRSEVLREAAQAVRAGFQVAWEHEPAGVSFTVIETSDAPQDVLDAYQRATANSDIVIGPLTRSGVAAVAQSNAVTKTTIALAAVDTASGTDVVLPPKMLGMGLSVEDEARQVAEWAAREYPKRRAVVLSTQTAWQKRAALAFERKWQQLGLQSEQVELASNDGFISGRPLLQLKKDMPADQPFVVFAALDARQARQARAVLGSDTVIYGTSQLNPIALSDRENAERAPEMNGAKLLDIPWQLQADHAAVAVYPRTVAGADGRRNADLERLYALGIDAYRVAREIAVGETGFELDGVTGRIVVRGDGNAARVERTSQPAIYRDGIVVVQGSGR